MLNENVVARLIIDGQREGLEPRRIAEQIVALSQDPWWARIYSHPIRTGILRLLQTQKSQSPRQAIDTLDVPIATASYHFRALAQVGLIEVVETIPRRGAVEHVYRLVPDAEIDGDATLRSPLRITPVADTVAEADADQYLTVTQAAREAGVTGQTVRNWIAAGQLTKVRVDGRAGVPATELQQLIDARARRETRLSRPG